MFCKVGKSVISGTVCAPPSKSHTMRAILFASMANGTSEIYNYLKSPDTNAMINSCKEFGAQITTYDSYLKITGVSGKPKQPEDIINVGNSGQVLRFVAAILSLIDQPSVLTGDCSIRFNRPMQQLLNGLNSLSGKCYSLRNNGHAPVLIQGPIKPGNAKVSGEDSQPISALLIATAFLPGNSHIRVENPGEKPWLALTLDWFDKLGIKYINHNFEHFTVLGYSKIKSFDYKVPGDFSSIAYPLVAAIITNSELKINNIDLSDVQGDKSLVDVLITMGANIKVADDYLYVAKNHNLQGMEIDVNQIIDAVPILAVIACFAKGSTKLYNAEIARFKESDRLNSITNELTKMGALISENATSLLIHESKLSGAVMTSYKDHRVALSLIVAALAASSDSTINDISCIKKSYPDFIKSMQTIGANIYL